MFADLEGKLGAAAFPRCLLLPSGRDEGICGAEVPGAPQNHSSHPSFSSQLGFLIAL